MKRRGKIIATIGPASESFEALSKLQKAGMDVARLNFSHGDYENFKKIINTIRDVEAKSGSPIGILQDLQGPRIRTGNLGNEGVLLDDGQKVTISIGTGPFDNEIPIDFPELTDFILPGHRIFFDSGALEIEVNKISKGKIIGQVVHGGQLSSNKGINLPDTKLDIAAFTRKDETDLKFGIRHGVNFVAVSFVSGGGDIVQVKNDIKKIDPKRSATPVIAKLERPEAIENLDDILANADGVMVARGDLGVEILPETVPIAQKSIIEAANKAGKIVITATQMLESMIHHPRPTRAEAADVANAIFDGTDAVMLSGETAIGDYPVRVIQTMDAIIQKSEENLQKWGRWQGTPHEKTVDDATSITQAARELANDRGVSAIVVFTETGRTAQLMAKALPNAPIFAFTPNDNTFYALTILRGVIPHRISFANTMEKMLAYVNEAMEKSTQIEPGQQVVVITGFPVGDKRPPNLALLYTLGD